LFGDEEIAAAGGADPVWHAIPKKRNNPEQAQNQASDIPAKDRHQAE
jgi:hypothetical protein